MIDKPRFKVQFPDVGASREEQFAKVFFYLAIGFVWIMVGVIIVAYLFGYRSVHV